MSWTNTLKLTLESSSVVAGLQAIVQGAGKASSAVGGIATAATAAGAKMLSAFKGVGDILFKLPDQVRALQGMLDGLSLPSKLAGSAETTQVAFSVLLGSAGKAREILGRIKTLAAETPFEFPELADSARKLAAFGEAADAIPDTLRRIGDIAAGTQSSISELAAIYGKARVAGTLYAEDINQLTERGIPVLQQFAAQLGVGVGQVKKLAADGQIGFALLEQAFKNLTSQGGQFSGMMEQISATFEGKMSTLTDSFNAVLAAMGAGINQGLKPVLDQLTRELDGQQGMAKKIGDAIGYGVEVGLDIIMSGEAGEVMRTQMEAAALEFTSVLMQGLEKAGQWLSKQLEEMGILSNQRATRMTMKDGKLVPERDEPGIDDLNKAARAARERANAALQGPQGRVDKKREERQNRDNLQGWIDAGKGAVNSALDWLKGDDTIPTGGAKKPTKPAKPTKPGKPAAPGAPVSPTGGLPSGDELEAMLTGKGGASQSGGLPAPEPPAPRETSDRRGGRRKIRGAQYSGAEETRADGADILDGLKRAGMASDQAAGMANNQGAAAKAASEAAENASKATVMLLKLLPEIAKDTRRTANNTESKK